MIALEVAEYCHSCKEFMPDVETTTYIIDDFVAAEPIEIAETVIRCIHRQRCEEIRRYIEKEGNRK